MSIAAFVAQVLERKDAGGEMMSVDHLSKICTLAVAESLDNVFGNKFDGFLKNFEKSFQSTLMTLRLINESSRNNGKQRKHLNHVRSSDLTPHIPRNGEGDSIGYSNIADFQSEKILNTISTEERSLEEFHENVQTDLSYRELVLHDTQINQQLSRVSPNTLHLSRSGINQSVLSTMEKSVVEQARSNDLKTFEIGLLMKKMQLKETQLALNCDSNFLERFKLSMGISKASFKAEKFKTELEDTRHAELLKTCVDCLVTGLLVMLASVAYGTYVYSHQRITEATASCIPSKDSNSWWIPKPMASFNSGLQILGCQVQVISRMLFGVLMIVAIAYLLLQRSSSLKQTMPVTFILLLLGVACGFAGKLCIDTLGGSGYHWLIYWEILCLLHFFSNVCTSALFRILYGPITVTEWSKGSKFFPYWIRRFLYYAIALLFLPMLCGFMPFAGFGKWKEHFSLLLTELLLPMRIE